MQFLTLILTGVAISEARFLKLDFSKSREVW
jgi:hypothetical protein